MCDFDVAIIGVSTYDLLLATYIKSIRKQAIQMSSATQILFGIKGKRWDSHLVILKMYNDYWVRPLAEETLPCIQKVEVTGKGQVKLCTALIVGMERLKWIMILIL